MRLIFSIGALACIAGATSSTEASRTYKDDLVSYLPLFGSLNETFKTYSGMLKVPIPEESTLDYSALYIRYQFHESQRSPEKDPVVTWHQGGPGGSSLYGAYGEMGFYQIFDKGAVRNAHSWNRVANMLYLESPAGSSISGVGFSYCVDKSGKMASSCSWNDVNQGEAYAYTLEAFFKFFPQFAKHDLYFTGESYAGQYLPNIANFIVNKFWPQKRLTTLKGFAAGNACWGGSEHSVECNGPNEQKLETDLFHGKGLMSNALKDEIYDACGFESEDASEKHSRECSSALDKMSEEVGPHNVYDIYDNCPLTMSQVQTFLDQSGKSMRWLRSAIRQAGPEGLQSSSPILATEHRAREALPDGGFDWNCGAMSAIGAYFNRKDVQRALHLPTPANVQFNYKTSGPASITLYPSLIKKLDILIYNGDADSCVPYNGNEEWTTDLAKQKLIKQTAAWHPWFTQGQNGGSFAPAGYATTYSVEDSDKTFQFVTIRLAGHMVPSFRPKASFTFFEKYLAGEKL